MTPGDEMARWKEGGILIRAVEGSKSTDQQRDGTVDNRFEVQTPGGEWVPWTNRAQVLMAGLVMQNEDNLYPPERGYRGGGWLLDALRAARVSIESGWRLLR